MPKIGRKLMGWDECEMVENEVKYKMENWEDCGYDGEPDEDELRNRLHSDSGFFEDQWEFMTEYLTERMKAKNKDIYWKVSVKNFGWRNIDGCKYIKVETGKELLEAILPNTQCTFKIHNYGKGLAIQNFHHDSPMGNEWYYVMPCAMLTFEKNNY